MNPKCSLFLALLLVGLLPHAVAARPRLPAKVFRALDAPTAVTVYSIDPHPDFFRRKFSRKFLDYPIIGKVTVNNTLQRQVGAFLSKTAKSDPGADTKCAFSPRHAVRLTSGSKTYDFLICFECSKMLVYSGDEPVTGLSINVSSDLLNEILQSSRIRIAP